MQIHFTKMTGAGNDFVLVDNRTGQLLWQGAATASDSEGGNNSGGAEVGCGCRWMEKATKAGLPAL